MEFILINLVIKATNLIRSKTNKLLKYLLYDYWLQYFSVKVIFRLWCFTLQNAFLPHLLVLSATSASPSFRVSPSSPPSLIEVGLKSPLFRTAQTGAYDRLEVLKRGEACSSSTALRKARAFTMCAFPPLGTVIGCAASGLTRMSSNPKTSRDRWASWSAARRALICCAWSS